MKSPLQKRKLNSKENQKISKLKIKFNYRKAEKKNLQTQESYLSQKLKKSPR